MQLTTHSICHFKIGDVVRIKRLHNNKRYSFVAYIVAINDTFLLCNSNNFNFKIAIMDGRYELRLIGQGKIQSR